MARAQTVADLQAQWPGREAQVQQLYQLLDNVRARAHARAGV